MPCWFPPLVILLLLPFPQLPAVSTASQVEKGPEIPSDEFDGLAQMKAAFDAEKQTPRVEDGPVEQGVEACPRVLSEWVSKYIYRILSQTNVELMELFCLNGCVSIYFSSFESIQLKLTPSQTKNALKTYMDSVLSTCGKLRSLLREVDQNYKNSSTMQTCISQFFVT